MTDLLEATEDGIAWLTLNRPERLNAFSPTMLQALRETLPRLGSDPQIGAIVVTGAGRGFCAGGDVKTMETRVSQPGSASPWPAICALPADPPGSAPALPGSATPAILVDPGP